MNDYDHKQRRKNLIVGSFVIIGMVLFAALLLRFGEMPVGIAKLTSFEVKVLFRFAPGVQENTPVQYCGYHIGRVVNVAPPMPVRQGSNGIFVHQVMVTMAISRNYATIPANVRIELIKRGLGSSYIELKSEPISANELKELKPQFLQDVTEPIQGYTGSASEFLPEEIQVKIEGLFDKVTMLVDNVNAVIGDQGNRDNFKQALTNLSIAAEESIETLRQIREFSETGREGIRQANSNFANLSDSVIETNQELAGAIIEFRRVVHKINQGEGTVGRLVNDDRLYEALLDSSQELQMAIENMNKTFEKTSKKGIRISIF